MAKPKPSSDGKPTPAKRKQTIRYLKRHGDGAHVPRPINCLVQDTPAQTIERCQNVVNWLAHIEQPFTGADLDAAEADVLHMVADALRHAERVVRSIGSPADAERESGVTNG